MNDKKTLAWFGAFVVVVVLAGIAGGVLLDRFLLRPPPRGGVPLMGPGGPGPGMMMGGGRMGPGMGAGRRNPAPGPVGVIARLASELDLTAAQQEQVRGIVARRRERLNAVRTEMQDRMQKEQADLRAEIRAVLNEGQQKRFDEAMSRAPGFRRAPGRKE
jgi:hypothetical protein